MMATIYHLVCLGLLCCVVGTPCHNRPCGLHGSCAITTDTATGFTCTCNSGYTGDACEVYEKCNPNPCHGGICSEQSWSPYYRCSCHDGYTGNQCQYRDACASNPCPPMFICQQHFSYHRCLCPSGHNCSDTSTHTQVTDPCSNHPCQHGGICHADQSGSFTCRCQSGFKGDTCEANDYCDHFNPCGSYGTCTQRTGYPYYHCSCHTGYYGTTCHSIDHCASSPCQSGYTCYHDNQHSLGYTCSCTHPPCADACHPNPCEHSGRCTTIDTSPFYQCSCNYGFSGTKCERDSCDPNPCQHGTCSRHSTGYHCQCNTGYHGRTCATQSCLTTTCQNNGTCVARSYSPYYRCTCPTGFKGLHCESIDHCLEHPCPAGLECVQTNTDNPGYQCECRNHFCQSNRCMPNPCGNGGHCSTLTEAPFYKCDCSSGFFGTQCRGDPCEPNPCQHGRCTRRTITPLSTYHTSFHCTCDHGYHGIRCETESCLNNRCQNGGTCLPSSHSYPYYYTCRCPAGFTGTLCEAVDQCASSPCPNGLTCQHTQHLSPPGYQCNNLHYTHDRCIPDPCGVGGHCNRLNVAPFYKCTCQPGFSGTQCRIDICDPNPCHHGHCEHNVANQLSSSTSYTCSCIHGYHGPTCQNPSCTSTSCHHGGTCISINKSPFFRCSCPYGFTGVRCDVVAPTTTSTTTTTPKPTPKPTTKATTTTPRPTPIPTTKATTTTPRPTPKPTTKATTTTPRPTPKPTTKATTTTPRPTPKPTTKATTTTQKPTVVPTTKATTPAPNHGPYCLTCNDVISPDTCEYVSLCGVHEVCYIEEYVTSIGTIRFNLGCRDSKQCQAKRRDIQTIPFSPNVDLGEVEDQVHILACTGCCSHNLCNTGGCGNVELQPQATSQRGPVCFHCSQQTDPQSCEKIKICGRDEFCSVQMSDVGTSNRTVWTSGCQTKHTCLEEQSTTGDHVEAALPTKKRYINSYQSDGSCKMSCCHMDLCNRICRDSLHTG